MSGKHPKEKIIQKPDMPMMLLKIW